MARKELKWVEAAEEVLSVSHDIWMTAPEMVREIQRLEIKSIKNSYGQAVRTLRSTLTGDSKKPHCMFDRSDGDVNVSFALRARLTAASGARKQSHSRRKKVPPPLDKDVQAWVPPVSNGLPEVSPRSPHPPPPTGVPSPPNPHSSPTHMADATPTTVPMTDATPTTVPVADATPTIVPMTTTTKSGTYLGFTRSTLVIEIDPSVKPSRPSSRSNAEVNSRMCLPSPLTSILGPRKTLQVLSETCAPATLRPVRQVRKRHHSKDIDEAPPPLLLSPSLNGCTPEGVVSPVSPPCVVHVETCHMLPSPLYEVACVRAPQDTYCSSSAGSYEDPCCAQGKRSHSGVYDEAEPRPPNRRARTEEDGFDTADSASPSDFSEDSESELSDIQASTQPRPSSRLLVSRRLRQHRRRTLSTDYSQLSESMSELDELEDVDVEYVDHSACNSSRPPQPPPPREGGLPARRGNNRSKYSTTTTTATATTQEAKKVEQKRNISSLFQPQSPLISENMKSLLNMEAFLSLTGKQKSQLVKLLPAVDRAGPSAIVGDSLNNSFFSSALREWLEQVALGTFTAEYKARLRSEEKKKAALKVEDAAWKAKFFEENWGDSADDDVTHPGSTPQRLDSTPFYPHPKLSDSSAAHLKAILEGYHGNKDRETPPPFIHRSQAMPPSVSATLPPSLPHSVKLPSSNASPSAAGATHPVPATPTSCHSSPQRTTTQSKKVVWPHKMNSVTGKRAAEVAGKHLPTRPPGILPQRKNHVAKRVAPKLSLPFLLTRSSRVPKTASKKAAMSNRGLVISAKNSVEKLKASKVIEQLKLNSHYAKAAGSNPGQFLTLIPSSTPYQTLLMALSQACSEPPCGAASSTSDAAPSSVLTDEPLSSSSSHTHSVFHDHFALLSTSHVPSEFSPPITSLAMQLPIDIYTSCLRARVSREEHSYAKQPGTSQPADGKRKDEIGSRQLNLKLSLPRYLLQSSETTSLPCGCDRGALVFCSSCRSLYHATCSSGTLCSNCVTLRSLNLS